MLGSMRECHSSTINAKYKNKEYSNLFNNELKTLRSNRRELVF